MTQLRIHPEDTLWTKKVDCIRFFYLRRETTSIPLPSDDIVPSQYLLILYWTLVRDKTYPQKNDWSRLALFHPSGTESKTFRSLHTDDEIVRPHLPHCAYERISSESAIPCSTEPRCELLPWDIIYRSICKIYLTWTSESCALPLSLRVHYH